MPAPGRFQSRIFSEINRQRLRWGDRLGRSWRYSRMSLIWATQIVLYPIYAGFQSVRLLGQQLAQAPRRLRQAGQVLRRAAGLDTPPPAPALNASSPIQQTLQAVAKLGVALPSGEAIAALPGTHALTTREPASEVAPVTLQGIASDRAQRHLVLVAQGNQVLDLLTPAQQEILHRRIIVALAEFGRDRQQAIAQAQPPLPLLPPRPTARMLPPVRWFLRLMQWEQHSEVARATNLFQECALSVGAAPAPAAHRLDSVNRPTDAPKPRHGLTSPPLLLSQSRRHPIDPALRSHFAALQTGTEPLRVTAETASDAEGSTVALATLTLAGRTAPPSVVAMPQLQVSPPPTSELTATEPPDLQAEPSDPDAYVEAQVQMVKYVKHPLEQVLGWLDRSLAWLEDRVLALRQWWNQLRS